MKKTYILDTNILLDDPNSLYAFDDCNVVLPFIVIEELDRHKDRKDIVGANARDVARKMSDFIKQHGKSLHKGVKLENDSNLYILSFADLKAHDDKLEDIVDFGDHMVGDNLIIDFVRKLRIEHRFKNPVLVTRDALLQIKCNALDIPCEDYRKDAAVRRGQKIYTGRAEQLMISDVLVSKIYENYDDKNFVISLDDLEDELGDDFIEANGIYPNTYVTFMMYNDPNQKIIGPFRYDAESGGFVKLIEPKVTNYTPRNLEQKMALDMLMNPEIQLCSLTGISGSGKSLLTIAAALEQTHMNAPGAKASSRRSKNARYDCVVVTKPVQAVGKDIGYLPGPVPLYSRILTPTGWKTMGEIAVGDNVISREGTPTQVTGVFKKGTKEILEITFEDGITIECCEDHPWAVYKVNSNKRKVLTTKEIEHRQNQLGWTKKWWNRLFIDVSQPVHYQRHDVLEIHPYILGCILGDGCVTQDYANELSTTDLEMVERINSYLDSSMVLKHKSGHSYAFVMKDNIGRKANVSNTLTESINQLGLRTKDSQTKFIPEHYLFASVENRRLLLQGLMDTDGYVSKDGRDVSYSTTSSQLAQDVKALVLSLGGLAVITHKPNKSNSYEVSVSFDNVEMCPFLLERKVSRWKPRKNTIRRRIETVVRTGRFTEMQCISVDHPEHLYLMDHFVVTHNTKEEKMDPWIAPIKDNIRYMLNKGKKDADSERILQTYFDSGTIEIEAITYMRGRSIANAFIIIEEAQNCSLHELKTILTRVGENSKIVILGDINQIDSLNLDYFTNGLSNAIEKFKTSEIAAHVTLEKGVRSPIATLAAELL